MWRKVILTFIVLGTILLAVPGALAQEKSYSAERFDVDIVVQADGSLLVTETVVFRFVGEPFTFVFRELPTKRTDGIEILEASVDGRTYSTGTDAGQVEIESGDDVLVTWHLEPTANVSRNFVLKYQVFGVVQKSNGVDLLRYQPLPDEFEYSIDSSTITVRYPDAASLQEAPLVTAGEAQVERSGNVVTITGQNLNPDQTLVFEMDFAEGSLIAEPPAWQARQAEQRAWAPLWLGLSLAILATGTAGIWWIWRAHRPQTVKETAVFYEPPNDLPPATAGVLNSNAAKPGWPNALATLFDLADRGILQIEESADKKWYQNHDFRIVLQKEPDALRPHEQGLLDLLFDTKEGRQTTVKLSKLNNVVTGKQWKKFAEPLEAELKAAGYIDEERKARRKSLIGYSFLFFALAFLVTIATPAFLEERFGVWPLAVAGSLFVLFIIWIAVSSTMTILTDEAKVLADSWQRFYEYMKNVTRKKATVNSTDMFNRFLPYAASYGLLPQWAKFFQKEGWTELPPYFHALSHSSTEGMAAFVAMTSATSSSGGSAAGAGGAGAGAAGGGASGAG